MKVGNRCLLASHLRCSSARKCTHQKHRRHATQSRASRSPADREPSHNASNPDLRPGMGTTYPSNQGTEDQRGPRGRPGGGGRGRGSVPGHWTAKAQARIAELDPAPGPGTWVKSLRFGSLDRLGRDRLLLLWVSLAVSRTCQAHLKHGWSSRSRSGAATSGF